MNVTAINLPSTVSAALMVIAGNFGNMPERKIKLEESGYNYEEVRNCVNDLLPILKKYA